MLDNFDYYKIDFVFMVLKINKMECIYVFLFGGVFKV